MRNIRSAESERNTATENYLRSDVCSDLLVIGSGFQVFMRHLPSVLWGGEEWPGGKGIARATEFFWREACMETLFSCFHQAESEDTDNTSYIIVRSAKLVSLA